MIRFRQFVFRIIDRVKLTLTASNSRANQMENRLDQWNIRWEENKTGWHLKDVNCVLLNHGDLLLSEPSRRVLVPLCGKTLDLKWFYDGGHTVVGIEGIEMPIVDFFSEHDIPYVVEQFPDGKLYKSKDGRLLMYCCDLFKLNAAILGKFDAIWDRGSLVAIYEEDRENYAKLMKSVLAPDFRYLASIVQYTPTEKFSGPPRTIPTELLQELYGDVCEIKIVESIDRSQDEKVRNTWELDAMDEVVVLMTPKH
ncbi:probable thiopurine S-methyltransferase [Macrobrachium rosenbergii]|uniref:probable thiopurine S-methyltransferase n=1 Tax=Macrobrachium rosenbergii TaxID=79674 RepID=UPI0034D676DF